MRAARGRARAVAALVACLSCAAHLAAQDEAQRPRVRASLAPNGPVVAGEPVTLTVDVLVPTWFPRAPQFPEIALDNAIATLEERGLSISERIGDDTWAGIRRRYTVTGMSAGTVRIDRIPISVVYALPNARPSEPVVLSPPALAFEVRLPAEAAGLGYFIATTRLGISQRFDPAGPVDTIRVGDALTRTVTVTAVNAPAMVIPPMPVESIAGARAYPDAPVLRDEGGERGSERRATRIDATTYVFADEGSYTLPSVTIAWWDVTARRLRRDSVPGVALVVVPDPEAVVEFPVAEDSAAAVPMATDDRSWLDVARWIGLGVLLVLGGWWGWRRFGSSLAAACRQAAANRRESETAYFRAFRAACWANDPAASMRALVAWLDRRAERPGTLAAFVAQADDPALAAAAAELEGILYGEHPRGGPWSGNALLRAVSRNRRPGSHADARARTQAGLIARLNP